MLSLCSCARRSTSRIFLIDTLLVGIGYPHCFLLTEGADQLIECRRELCRRAYRQLSTIIGTIVRKLIGLSVRQWR
jgi:hypothetical protein